MRVLVHSTEADWKGKWKPNGSQRKPKKPNEQMAKGFHGSQNRKVYRRSRWNPKWKPMEANMEATVRRGTSTRWKALEATMEATVEARFV
jgi:hypothetical protein